MPNTYRSRAAGTEEAGVVAAAARFFTRLPTPPIGGAVWKDTFLPLRRSEETHVYRDVLTGHVIRVQEGPHGPELPMDGVFRHLPSALLEREA
jgi:hypothetical protein